MGAKSDDADEAGAAEGSNKENAGNSSDDEGMTEVVTSDTSTEVGSAVAGSEVTGVASLALISLRVGSVPSVGGLAASEGVAEGEGVAPVPVAPRRDIPLPVGNRVLGSAGAAEASEAVSDAMIVGSAGLAEVKISEVDTAVAMVEAASTSD